MIGANTAYLNRWHGQIVQRTSTGEYNGKDGIN
jgi:hypothetical protein